MPRVRRVGEGERRGWNGRGGRLPPSGVAQVAVVAGWSSGGGCYCCAAVSYTHLTLPTILLV
eukprot:364233-Chlamydomonas_euryale.AAC.7